MSLGSIIGLLMAASLGADGVAQERAPACPAELPFLSAGEGQSVARTHAATAAAALSAAAIPLETRVDLTLSRAGDIRFVAAPEREALPDRHGGMASFRVETAGRYRVQLGSGAWIDVASDTALVTSVAHGHGPDCSGIRKMVDFDLQPGVHVLQISGSEAPSIRVRVTKLP